MAQQTQVKKTTRPTTRRTEEDLAEERRSPSGQPMNR